MSINIKESIKSRTLDVADYIIKTGCTIREASDYAKAKYKFASHPTIHRDMTTILPELDIAKARQVNEILGKNREDSYVKGGIANRDRILFTKNAK